MASGRSGGSSSRVSGSSREAVLHLDLQSLASSTGLHFESPKELTIYSSAFKDHERILEEKEDAENIPENWKRFTATSTCRRTLHKDPTAHRMEFSTPGDFERVDFDLYSGFGSQTERDNENQYLNILLECLQKESLVGNSDFVCQRTLLTELGVNPYEAGGKFDAGQKIVVQKLGGVYYMFDFPTPESKLQTENWDDNRKRMVYGGKKFESYVTAKPGRSPDTTAPLNNNHEFYSVVRSKIGSHSLIYRGEIDCCSHDDQKRYIELKTRREFDHEGQRRSFHRFQLIKWWLQSYLIGVDSIFCGFRNDDGVVRRCKLFEVSKLPDLFEKYERRRSVCLAFLESFLTFVKDNVDKDLDVYIFTRKAGKTVFTVELDKTRKHKFLPYWFVKDSINDGKA